MGETYVGEAVGDSDVVKDVCERHHHISVWLFERVVDDVAATSHRAVFLENKAPTLS